MPGATTEDPPIALADHIITIDASVEYKGSFSKKIGNDAVYLTSEDPIFGKFLAIVYKARPNSDLLSAIVIGRNGVNESVDMTLNPKSRYYSACLNLPQEMASSMVRKALAVACLRTYANMEMTIKKYLTEASDEALQFDWDETTAGHLAASLTPATGRFPGEIGNTVIDCGLLQPKFIRSIVIDIVYQDLDSTNDSNNELVYLFGNQLEHLFDPLSEYSPEPTELLYSPPPHPSVMRPGDDRIVQSVCQELFSLQSHFTTDLLCFLQDYLIPLRVKALGGEIPDLTIRRLNTIFPPTIDEVVRVNNIFYEALDASIGYGSYEVMKACGVSIPYFYKACMRHEAATRNFTQVINENYDLLKVHAPMMGRYTIHRMESIIHFSLHLTKIKLVLERLIKIVDWQPDETPKVEEFYLSAVGTIDSFGRERQVSPYDNRIFTPTGKLLVEISKGWPQELEYGWINRRVVSIFDVQDLTADDRAIINIIFIFTDSVVITKPTQPISMTSDSGIHKPSIADMLMHSMINSMPLVNVPDLVVVGWAPIEDVHFATYGSPMNLAMYITGNGLKLNTQEDSPGPSPTASTYTPIQRFMKKPQPLSSANTSSSTSTTRAFTHLKLFRLIRPGIDADTVANYISKAKIMNKTQPFHLFQSSQPNLTTYATVHEYQGYRLESRKCPIAIFANLKISPALLDNYNLIACIGVQIYNSNLVLIRVVSKLGYDAKSVVSKENFAASISSHIARIYSLYFSSGNELNTSMIAQNNAEIAEYLVRFATSEVKHVAAPRRHVSRGRVNRFTIAEMPEQEQKAHQKQPTPVVVTQRPQSQPLPKVQSLIEPPSRTVSQPMRNATPKPAPTPVRAVSQPEATSKARPASIAVTSANTSTSNVNTTAPSSKRWSLKKRVSASSLLSRFSHKSRDSLRESSRPSSTVDPSTPQQSTFPSTSTLTSPATLKSTSLATTPVFSNASSSTPSTQSARRKSSFSFLRRGSSSSSKAPSPRSSDVYSIPDANSSAQSVATVTSVTSIQTATPEQPDSSTRHSYPTGGNQQPIFSAPVQNPANQIVRRKKSFMVPFSPAIPEEPFDFSEDAGGVGNTTTIQLPKPYRNSTPNTAQHVAAIVSRRPSSLLRHTEPADSSDTSTETPNTSTETAKENETTPTTPAAAKHKRLDSLRESPFSPGAAGIKIIGDESMEYDSDDDDKENSAAGPIRAGLPVLTRPQEKEEEKHNEKQKEEEEEDHVTDDQVGELPDTSAATTAAAAAAAAAALLKPKRKYQRHHAPGTTQSYSSSSNGSSSFASHSYSVSVSTDSTFDNSSVQNWYNDLHRQSLENASLDSLDMNFVPGIDSNEMTFDEEEEDTEDPVENITRFIDERAGSRLRQYPSSSIGSIGSSEFSVSRSTSNESAVPHGQFQQTVELRPLSEFGGASLQKVSSIGAVSSQLQEELPLSKSQPLSRSESGYSMILSDDFSYLGNLVSVNESDTSGFLEAGGGIGLTAATRRNMNSVTSLYPDLRDSSLIFLGKFIDADESNGYGWLAELANSSKSATNSSRQSVLSMSSLATSSSLRNLRASLMQQSRLSVISRQNSLRRMSTNMSVGSMNMNANFNTTLSASNSANLAMLKRDSSISSGLATTMEETSDMVAAHADTSNDTVDGTTPTIIQVPDYDEESSVTNTPKTEHAALFTTPVTVTPGQTPLLYSTASSVSTPNYGTYENFTVFNTSHCSTEYESPSHEASLHYSASYNNASSPILSGNILVTPSSSMAAESDMEESPGVRYSDFSRSESYSTEKNSQEDDYSTTPVFTSFGARRISSARTPPADLVLQPIADTEMPSPSSESSGSTSKASPVEQHKTTVSRKQSQTYMMSTFGSLSDMTNNELELRALLLSIESIINEEFASLMASPDTSNGSMVHSSVSRMSLVSSSKFGEGGRKKVLSQLERINDTVFKLYERTRMLPPLQGSLTSTDLKRVAAVEQANRGVLMECAWTLVGIMEAYKDAEESQGIASNRGTMGGKYATIVQQFLALEWARRATLQEKLGGAQGVEEIWAV
ncbi:uncharacterized protein SAPINGB_P000563 [Magnusiomyces paraingens]|uniref:DH domain-containing protein n=1 Tax=Magnusiomyces paraingens TaxID=2606893 RepID=A0A5E8B1S5_9ASCO|nr:uncharacterized protein SAPINGB_P000563 [Saprochaete ingens]VVT44875.1 unnamed protein product [Saprochaete ingens]